MRVALLCFLLVCAILQASSVEYPEQFHDEHSIACTKKLKMDKSDLNNIMDESFDVYQNPTARSYKKCIFEGMNLVKDGEFVREATVNYIATKVVPFYKPNVHDPAVEAGKAYDRCEHVEGGKDGERIVNFINCVNAELRK
ncbi:hypothetical protein PPYR_14351 [Photinus pyralis]|uniref:Uncharacterized protein n=1 Tax=Photinus pyralis TaxID=7054 RepID=A0A1Y1LVH8_PHOPY|nr:uncharacterized protein LOC116180893 [Photinus pyralis]KAB0792392.1 hypothetical protein PPYR_14351 [Photinus pyralis]